MTATQYTLLHNIFNCLRLTAYAIVHGGETQREESKKFNGKEDAAKFTKRKGPVESTVGGKVALEWAVGPCQVVLPRLLGLLSGAAGAWV